jgi:hypothetical protein
VALSPAEVEARRLLLAELAEVGDWASLREAARQVLAVQPGEPAALRAAAQADAALRGDRPQATQR